MREYDPYRWEGVPITYQTDFCNNQDYTNIPLIIQIHDALEKEFNIDIDDRRTLLKNVKDCVNFVLENHQAI